MQGLFDKYEGLVREVKAAQQQEEEAARKRKAEEMGDAPKAKKVCIKCNYEASSSNSDDDSMSQ